MTGRKHGHSFNGRGKEKNTMDRLKWIDTVALAIREMSFTDAKFYAGRISEFVEAIRLMAKMGEMFIENNKDHFDRIFNTARAFTLQKSKSDMNDTRSEDEIREQLWEDDDSAETDEENKEWYRQRAGEFEFHPMLTTCGYCNEREACYNGITFGCYDVIDNKSHNGVIFQFCKICRDKLQMIKLQTKASRP
jgi:hypothetical protein